MVDVGLAAAAAPSYFRPLEHSGYMLVDGGVWSNNPIMTAVIEALTCFELDRNQIDVFSLGCGEDRYVVSEAQIKKGGLWHWRKIIDAAICLQSLAATNQARLLLGPPSVLRLDPPTFEPKILLDDWRRSVAELIPAADAIVADHGEHIAAMFLGEAAAPFVAVPTSL
jgi:patatin-like phospholipase